jgi:uncharacterized protein DUF6065
VKLIAYVSPGDYVDIRPAPVEREWMEATDARYAYRCWSPYPFTMNWIFTHPGVTVRFEAGEPYCHIFPVKRDEIEAFDPELREMSEDAELAAQYENWKARRAQFNEDLKAPGSEAQALRWQKHYYRGVDVHGHDAPIEDHRTRLRLKPFAEKR